MSLALEIINNISGYSCAKYSTWFYYRPDRILFDAGEGVSIAMRNMLYGIDMIVISHSHADHIGGLLGILRSRASSMGDKTKPLTIYYPYNDENISKLRDYIKISFNQLPFVIHWQQIQPGDTISLSGNRNLQTFASKHLENGLSLGYKIIEKRTRLKQEYREIPKPELIAKIRAHGKEALSETYIKNLLVYTGDTMPVDCKYINQAEVLLHDATFVRASDREENTHATIEEACLAAMEANVGCLALFHFSCRYQRQQIKEKIQKVTEQYQISFPVYYMFPLSYPMKFKSVRQNESSSENHCKITT